MTRPNYAPDAQEGTERRIHFTYDICAQGLVASHIEYLPNGGEVHTRICHCRDGENSRPGVPEAIANLEKWGVSIQLVPKLDDPKAFMLTSGYIALHDTPMVREQLAIIDTGFGRDVAEQVNALLEEARARGFKVGSMGINLDGDVLNGCALPDGFKLQVFKPWRDPAPTIVGVTDSGLLTVDNSAAGNKGL